MANEESPQRAAIITALSLECRAVCEHLENRRELTHPTGTIYERGSFTPDERASWDVIVVESGPGNVAAAVEVERVISFFRPELVLFVGVAGGLKDVGLGDVVVGTEGEATAQPSAVTFQPRCFQESTIQRLGTPKRR
ncbi:MAG: hypothetical protein ABSB15_19700 [Bryobacteraceae bacterium]